MGGDRGVGRGVVGDRGWVEGGWDRGWVERWVGIGGSVEGWRP